VLELDGQAPFRWGAALCPPRDLLRSARAAPRPLTANIEPGQDGAVCLLSPLVAGAESLGVLALSSDKPFGAEQTDLLFLLCSQAAMALSHAALYDQVVEARRQLEQSQASLVQSSKLTAIGQLAAGVAHELNSPLGAISLSVGEALHQLDEQPALARRLLSKAELAVERARAIVNRLMAYSRKPQHISQRLSLGRLVEETVEFLAFQLRTAGVDCSFESSGEVAVEGEEQPLQQVLTNLILNAAQAMEEVEPSRRRLEISLQGSDGMACLRVTDHGTGIAEEIRDRLLEPFFTTKPAGRGTGLGLWASQQIVTQHGGDLSVASEVGRGSTFTVSLPLADPT
jgi:C4-dicarboxylate-specific signal transduction histidine kinase